MKLNEGDKYVLNTVRARFVKREIYTLAILQGIFPVQFSAFLWQQPLDMKSLTYLDSTQIPVSSILVLQAIKKKQTNKFCRGIITHRMQKTPLHSLFNEVYELNVGIFSLIMKQLSLNTYFCCFLDKKVKCFKLS